jgi:ketosteroid isomerase-like protein
MKKLILFNLFVVFSILVNAQTAKDDNIVKAVEGLTAAMISGDRASLVAAVSDHLSYGHSGGHVEGKAEFVEKIASDKSDFVTIELSDQTIDLVKKIAIVRHTLNATTNDGGKPGVVKLKVLLIFQKEKGSWKLLARQAIKA